MAKRKMKTIKKKGIVISEKNNGESDKTITILTEDAGKIYGYVRGAKKFNNKLFASSQIFSFAEFLLSESSKNKNFYSVTQIDMIENLTPKNYIDLCYGIYFCELTNKYLLKNEPANNILLLLIKSLKILSSNLDAQYVSRIFEFKFMKLNGYVPETKSCHNCFALKNPMYFDEFGLVCQNCLDKSKPFCKISPPAINLLNQLVHIKFNNLIEPAYEKSVLQELIAPSRIFINSHLDININSKKFIYEIESQ